MKINLILLTLVYLFIHTDASAQNDDLKIYQEKSDNGYIFYADNTALVPYSVKLNFEELKNLQPDKDLKSYIALAPAKSNKVEILRLRRVKEGSASSYNFNYIFTVGKPGQQPDTDFAYWFPYRHGKKERVAQGNNGSGTHQGLNAIDFNLEEGEAVHAAREGLVIEVKEDSNTGGNNPKFEKDGNYIRIYHEDGTIASYVHLQKNGSLVHVGETVKAGDKIGISGNTGYSSGPHLHFMVTYNRDFQTLTLPVKFLNYDGKSIIPTEGKTYYAFHQGKPAFDVQETSNFNEKLYEQKLEKSGLKDNIKITSESLDDFTLIYVDNGFNKKMSGKLIITITNMESTKSLPHQFEVPAKTKMYLLTLKPKDTSKEFGYKLAAEFK
ncbi:hypothetical protein GCM10011506_40860 [Marivirga lumbricoides]|uniref:M23ase beta-sheet core domain-containing protein n=1 Tax=Marivirga lumbricoides TaxID=1046115 RepID=A0ABQ1N1F2_9BACT|nr:hypothetical protein GCM10011506_40860 [Marivirga lumbricoides]